MVVCFANKMCLRIEPLMVDGGKSIRAMANGRLITVGSHQTLFARRSYRYATELEDTEFFTVEKELDGLAVSMKSMQTGLYVCLDDGNLVASCDESIRTQHHEHFQLICYSHWRGNFRISGECKVFALRSLSTNRLVKAVLNAPQSENYGILRACFPLFYNFTNFANLNIQASEPTSAMLDDRQFYTTTFSFAKTYKSNDAEGQRSVLFTLITLTKRPES